MINRLLVVVLGMSAPTIAALSQDTLVYVYGTVKDYETSALIPSFSVVAIDVNDKTSRVDGTVRGAGTYGLALSRISKYRIFYTSGDYVQKHVLIDMYGPTDEDWEIAYDARVDIALFRSLEGWHPPILDEPIGKCVFNTILDAFTWDLQYTEAIRKKVTESVRSYKAGRSAQEKPDPNKP